jgi:hypothetical protein
LKFSSIAESDGGFIPAEPKQLNGGGSEDPKVCYCEPDGFSGFVAF